MVERAFLLRAISLVMSNLATLEATSLADEARAFFRGQGAEAGRARGLDYAAESVDFCAEVVNLHSTV